MPYTHDVSPTCESALRGIEKYPAGRESLGSFAGRELGHRPSADVCTRSPFPAGPTAPHVRGDLGRPRPLHRNGDCVE